MTDKSLERLNTLHPKIRKIAIAAYNESVAKTPKGVHPYIDECFRSFAKSDALYAQGRTTPGKIVSDAKGGSSFHNYGLALDFHLQINGKDIWPANYRANKDWMTVVNIFKKYGFKWGAEFNNIDDYPHLELTLGHTWRELLKLHNEDKVDNEGYVLI